MILRSRRGERVPSILTSVMTVFSRSPVPHTSPGNVLPPLEEFVRKSNMVPFGDVTVTNHPGTPPIPMTFPMVYLFPVSKDEVRTMTQSVLS